MPADVNILLPPVKTQPSFYTPPLQDYSSRGRSWSLAFGGAGGDGGRGGGGGGGGVKYKHHDR